MEVQPKNDTDIRNRVFSRIRQLYQHPTKLFPTQQPFSIERKDLPVVFQPDNYVVSQKANGIHITLLISEIDGVGNTCCTMDRCQNLVFFKVVAPKELFAGTLILGEMIGSLFFAFDVIVFEGTSLLNDVYGDRMQKSTIMDSYVSTSKFKMLGTDGFLYKTKPFYPIDSFLDDFCSVSDDDGLIFMPSKSRVGLSRPFKWKKDHTVDLLISVAREPGCGFSYKIVQPVVTGLQLDTTCPLLRTMDSLLLETNIEKFTVIIECTVAYTTAIPVIIRYDKNVPNQACTVISALKCIEENITKAEITEWFLFARRTSITN